MFNTNSHLPIREIKIEKLFGLYNYTIQVKNWISIIVWENWIWKTKILNIIYAILSENINDLLNYDFSKIKIYFEKWKWKFITITRKDIYKDISEHDFDFNITFPMSIRDNIDEIREDIIKNNITSYKDIRYSKVINYRRYNPRIIDKLIKYINSSKFKNEQITDIVSNKEILYFPTYRRIEEDIINLWFDIDEIDTKRQKWKVNLINFWMDDVIELFTKKEEEIKDILAQGISRLTWDILSELYNIKNNKDKIKESIIDISDLDIVLSRVSDYIQWTNKKQIIDLCNNWEINKDSHLSLKSVLLAFVEQYKKQKLKEEVLIKFVSVCNSYLNNKKLVYDENNIKLYIELINWEKIDLSNLSSWEKQMISILSKIFLNSDKKFIILFDEPELSLSISWQERLLSDILESGNIDFLLAVTHSPFIVNDKLQEYASFINNDIN